LIPRWSSSGIVNDTDAAQWTMRSTRSASQSRRRELIPSHAWVMSPRTAIALSDHGSAVPSRDSRSDRSRSSARSSSSARTST